MRLPNCMFPSVYSFSACGETHIGTCLLRLSAGSKVLKQMMDVEIAARAVMQDFTFDLREAPDATFAVEVKEGVRLFRVASAKQVLLRGVDAVQLELSEMPDGGEGDV